jgi:hypothetical protein
VEPKRGKPILRRFLSGYVEPKKSEPIFRKFLSGYVEPKEGELIELRRSSSSFEKW